MDINIFYCGMHNSARHEVQKDATSVHWCLERTSNSLQQSKQEV